MKLPRSTFELLFRAARLVNERALARIQQERERAVPGRSGSQSLARIQEERERARPGRGGSQSFAHIQERRERARPGRGGSQSGARPQGHPAGGIRMAHTTLFPHITTAGVRLTTLADKLGVTKQAIGPLVDDLEREGVIERVDDPADRRAKLIRWTKQGERALLHGLGVLAELERELAKSVGKARMAELADTLERLIAAIDDR